MTRIVALTLAAAGVSLAGAAERASYDSAGKLTSLIFDGAELEVRAGLAVVFEGGVEVPLQPHDQRAPITRDGLASRWTGTTSFPNGASAQFAVAWTESDDGIKLESSVTNPGQFPLDVKSLDYVIDLPRELLVGGTLEPGGIALPATNPGDAVFFRGTAARLAFADARQNWTVALAFDRERPVTVTDRWDRDGRSYRVRVQLKSGLWPGNEAVASAITLAPGGSASAAAAHLTIDPAARGYRFDGYGGNLCWGNDNAVTDYMLEHLRLAWSRHELKAIFWDRERAAPGPQLRRDFELMQRVQRSGVPWIISVWRLPERFYTDPNQKPFGAFARQIAADRWDELLELFGSYLLHVKQNYGAEPDLFSFNEPDLGVSVGFTAETHREMTRRVGAHLAALGLKTRMLLGDTANPRDSHRYVLATAADAEAMRHVGAVSFHSWNNGTPEQYRAWGDVAEWLRLPLLVGEAGVDPGAWRNHAYDSYDYGLDEAKQALELLRYARPTASLYWQFTQDYGLARLDENGGVQPTGRFWLMKHFTDLTPGGGDVVASSSDQADVLVSAFRRGETLAVHVLNLGPARAATLDGLPAGAWRIVVTTEAAGFQESNSGAAAGAGAGTKSLTLPARSLTSLVTQ